MKRLLLIILLLVVCSSVQAARGHLDSLRNYEVQVKIYLNVDTTNTTYITTGALDHLIREAIITNMVLMRGDKTTDASKVTTALQNTYALDSLMLGVSAVTWVKNDSVKSLLYVPREKWYEMEHKITVGQEDNYQRRPSYYDYDDDNVYLFPVPHIAGDTIEIAGWQRIGTLDGATAFSAIQQKYRTVIARCAAWLVADSKQHPSAAAFKNRWMELLSAINAATNPGGISEPTNK